jgi:TolA-binding protein
MIRLRRAQLCALRGEWDLASRLASTVAALCSDFGQQHEVDYLLGRCAAARAEFQQAREHYHLAIAQAGHSETAAMAQWMIGETFFHQKDYDRAIREYLRIDLLYDFPRWRAAALLEAAKCSQLRDQAEQAAELYTKLLDKYPESSLAAEAANRLRELTGGAH